MREQRSSFFMSLMIISHCSARQWGTFGWYTGVQLHPVKTLRAHGDLWINCLTQSTPVTEHTRNFPYVWACAIFSVASCLHHYLASNCTSLLTLKCLKSNFKLENIFKFSENIFFFTLNIPAQGCAESHHAAGLYALLHLCCKDVPLWNIYKDQE